MKMSSCSYSLLALCLVTTYVSGIFGYGGSLSPSEELERQRNTDGHEILSRFLNDPNLRVSADGTASPSCDPNTPYRTYNGTCNNLQNPTFGSVEYCMVRLLPASYEGETDLRKAVNGDPLPAPRDLTLNIFNYKNSPTPQVTLFFTLFGQLMTHDISLSTAPVGQPGLLKQCGIRCCPMSQAQSPDCSSIEIRSDDPFYSKFNVTCMDFLRGHKCLSGKQQIGNKATAAIDLSIVYGKSKDEAEKLRTKDGTGRLKGSYNKYGEFLPVNQDPSALFCPVGETTSCFTAGDIRVNQHTYLTSLQTILLREHNRMVTKLKLINPHWDDETLYQTARRILGAKFQAIVYSEYAPVLLGSKYMDEFKLWVKDEGQSTQYDPSLRFGVFIEFATGTFRAHSMIPSKTGYRTNLFKDMFSNSHPIHNGEMSQVIFDSCRVTSQKYTRYEAPDVVNFLYKQPDTDYGLDLVAIDIHRGRDHGLPPYIHLLNYWRPSNNMITSYEQLSEIIPQEHIELLKKNYRYIGDIDLFVGIQMENIMEGSLLPPTAASIIGGQLHFIKYGDRFYFEHADQPTSFTLAQRESLKKSTMGRLICENTDIVSLQMYPFLFENEYNPVLPCSEHPEVDLNLWKSTE